MPTPSPSGPSTPESILAAWLSEPDREEDVEALCQEHPEHAKRLRQLFEHWRDVQGLLRQQAGESRKGLDEAFAQVLRRLETEGTHPPQEAGAPDLGDAVRELWTEWQRIKSTQASLAERLKNQYGSGVDPQVTLSLSSP
jgi:hypothetical protein